MDTVTGTRTLIAKGIAMAALMLSHADLSGAATLTPSTDYAVGEAFGIAAPKCSLVA